MVQVALNFVDHYDCWEFILTNFLFYFLFLFTKHNKPVFKK